VVVTSRIPTGPGLLLTLTVALLGCGAAGPTPATHDDFRAIQRHETVIEHALAALRDDGAPCPDRCDAAAEICAARDAICHIAEDTADLDARSRCRQASDACEESQGLSCECHP